MTTLYIRWVGRSPHTTSNELSTDSTIDPSQSPACEIASATVVKHPVILQTLALPRERYGDDDFPDDPLLSKDSTTGDLSATLYPRHSGSPASNGSSPMGNRRHQFTVIPMKPINEVDKKISRQSGNEALGLVLSALYGKLLVVMGIAFPMSEVISTYIPPAFYDGFYLYLYFGSITFMICILGNILRQKATRSVRSTIHRINTMKSRLTSTSSAVAPDVTSSNDPPDISCDSEGSASVIEPSPIDNDYAVQRIHFGSFYLRMGAVAFGIGSMIYSGLEFGQYFELEPDTKCHNVLIALTPAVRMMFTFMQMYFIFLNSKMAVSKVRLGAQFGLMHMIGTNLCVWLNVLVQETRHEILQFYNPDNNTINLNHGTHLGFPRSHHHGGHYPQAHGHGHGLYTTPRPFSSTTEVPAVIQNLTSSVTNLVVDAGEAIAHHRVKRGLKGPHSIYECRRTDIMGALVQNASPFLFPCTIEYSLICAAILYVMWKSLAKGRTYNKRGHSIYQHGEMHMYPGAKRSPHHYSVDCARANKGLFLGIFVLVLTIISLILFFVLITRPGYQALATLEVNITELVLYTTTTVAVLIGMCQVRELKYVRGRNLELDNILLIVAQTGSFIYNVFTIIGGHFTMKKHTVLVLMTALASLIQLLFQTLFILDASKRSAATSDQARRKPGREVVTFLLVTNLAMWAINTLEKSRADSHPVQLRFYGVWAWTIITHISMPLAIFYRFHSTVCLCEIWKRAYKIKPSAIYR
ncbi:unnamed protein product [Allacma fusca]|uniref:Otopetrin-2 n=1 Tax=Allacma fusca TaxID=39272 RepID=A0A8J2JGH7_9HEXA|nr:unnamed protein product [Allacma fusca]